MSDYISREDAKLAVVDVAQSRENGFQWGEAVTFTPSKIIGLINKIPAAEVKPVVRGKWELIERRIISKVQIWKCSNCGNILEVRETTFNAGRGDCNYCPNCGADMKED